MAEWQMTGEYLKNCNGAPTCSCDTTGDPLPHAYCEGLLGMRIHEGRFDGIGLSGLKWVGVVHFPGAMHQGNGAWEVYIDKRASAAQRDALQRMLSGKAGGTLFEIIAAVAPRHVGTHFVPIDWQFDKAQRRASVAIPGFVETTTEPLRVVPTGQDQRVIVRLPNGFEHKEMEVARAIALRSSGKIRFEWQGTHSSLAHVEHTHTGLVACRAREGSSAARTAILTRGRSASRKPDRRCARGRRDDDAAEVLSKVVPDSYRGFRTRATREGGWS